MTSLVTSKFRLLNSKTFINDVTSSTDGNYYTFIGRPYKWPVDLSPLEPSDSIKEYTSVWDNIMSMKKIGDSDISHAIYRRNWTSGKYYDIWRHDWDGVIKQGRNMDTGYLETRPMNQSDSNYYAVTENGSVYICLSNNNGTSSLINPQTIGTGGSEFLPVRTSDGYIWKYIASTGAVEINKFQSTYYHPVKTLGSIPSDTFYEDQWYSQEYSKNNYGGSIFVINLTSFGSGYTQTQTVDVDIIGDGTGAEATAEVDGNGRIVKITMTEYGNNYTWARVALTAPANSGSTALAEAIITPLKGLGADPVADLNAHFVAISSQFQQDEGEDFSIAASYRQIGVLSKPLNLSNNSLSSSTANACQTFKITMGVGSSISNFVPETIIRSVTSGGIGRIVDSFSTPNGIVIRIIRTEEEHSENQTGQYGTFQLDDQIQTITGSYSASITEIVPANSTTYEGVGGGQEVKKYSGEVIYYENRRPIQRSDDLTENIIITFEF